MPVAGSTQECLESRVSGFLANKTDRNEFGGYEVTGVVGGCGLLPRIIGTERRWQLGVSLIESQLASSWECDVDRPQDCS
jgi:hypothetical protein